MQADANQAEIRRRIHQLEKQVLDLRRSIQSPREELPDEPFALVEVQAGGTWYAMPVAQIREVVQMALPTPLPDAPAWVRGTLQFGETILPVIDLGSRLHDTETPLALWGYLVISEPPDPCAFLIQDIRNVRTVTPGQIQPPLHDIPQGPYLIGSIADTKLETLHLLSLARLGRESLLP